MTYKEFIQNIINTRGQWNIPENEYYEIHHILPKCLGGLPLKIHDHITKHPNLVWLLPAEHYLAHKLLAEENPNNKKLIYAFWKLSNSSKCSAEDYALARQLYISARKNSVQSAEANTKRSEAMKQHDLKWYTNGEQEVRASVCPEGYHRGRKNQIKEISQKYFGKALVGNKNGMYGKHQTEESNKKRAEWTSARHWYNNGIKEVFEITCLQGFKAGRIKR